MEAVESGTMNVTEASQVFDIPIQTLNDRIKGKYTKAGGGRKTELTEDEESILVEYCMFMAKCSHPLIVPVVKAFAWAIVRKSNRPSRFHATNGPSWKWWQGFKKRHPEISLRKPDNLDRGRSRMNNQVVMDKFFKLLKQELESINILDKPEHMHSMLTRQELTYMQDQEKLLFLKTANMPIQNKRHQEIISLQWFVVVQLLDKSCDQ